MSRRAVFLDRDGVLTIPEIREGRSFAPRRLDDLTIYPDVHAALDRLAHAGFVLVVVTNQPDIGNGLLAPETLELMHRALADHLPLDAIEVCPHRQQDGCDCRKPAPGLLLRAADSLNVDPTASFMVGDRASDIAAGQAVGCATIFIDHGYEAESPPGNPDFTCSGMREAADWILGRLHASASRGLCAPAIS